MAQWNALRQKYLGGGAKDDDDDDDSDDDDDDNEVSSSGDFGLWENNVKSERD